MTKRRMYAVVACMMICIMLAGTITCYAAGNWSANAALSIPGFNQSRNTRDHANPQVSATKISADTVCSFYVNSVANSITPDGRLINSDYESRSAWARNLAPNNPVYRAATTAEKGHYYYAEISSDLAQILTSSINFKFSPDNMPG